MKGGYFMWPIFLCSIISLAVIIERFMVLKRKKMLPKNFLININDLLKNKKFQDAIELTNTKNTITSRLIKEVINNKEKTHSEIKELITEAGKREFEITERPLYVLSTIASISPLLGLLGTVSGMIKVFSVISIEGVGDPGSLAAGISEALFTTVAGLVVAIPTFVAFKYYQSKLNILSVIVEEETYKIINLLKRS
jgi:biopolymer transport protein ExbB